MKIAFCSSEVFPLAKTGGLADVCGALPLALERLGVEVKILLPNYRSIREANIEVKNLNQHLAWTRLGKNIDVYLIRNDELYDRSGLYGDINGDFSDNLKRFQYFSQQVLSALKVLNLNVDVVHCHDWHAALVPVYLKHQFQDDAFFAKIRTVLTVHNLAYQGVFHHSEYPTIGLADHLFDPSLFEFYGKINLLKAGILISDRVTTVSPQYAKEIQTKDFGCGLEEVLQYRHGAIQGILNGIDPEVWNPGQDRYLAQSYTSKTVGQGKAANKLALQNRLGLPARKDVPLFGFVGRLSHQKGVDLILESLDEILALDVQVAILGTGEGKYIETLRKRLQSAPKKLATVFEFDEEAAHLIYSGADFFMMPSVYEPCGLSQMIALAYGTLPIVRKTGGLIDTVAAWNGKSKGATGFIFERSLKVDFLKAIKQACSVYQDKKAHEAMVQNGLAQDFSWGHSAKEYEKLYQCLLSD